MKVEDSLFGMATKEEDEPILPNDIDDSPENAANKQDELETQKLIMEEKKEERRERRCFNAVKIFVGCLFFLGIVYGIDVIITGVFKGESSSITDSVIEIIKTLLFTLSGYLFARNEKDH